jgi:hypothetical protein
VSDDAALFVCVVVLIYQYYFLLLYNYFIGIHHLIKIFCGRQRSSGEAFHSESAIIVAPEDAPKIIENTRIS